ncbi:MAG TPA: T9SS type A sorting domain-containing protein [Bacteroidia bacterium]|nr:T9SS type A sorting domain-containing protein [Bacteroidia bacterium]
MKKHPRILFAAQINFLALVIVAFCSGLAVAQNVVVNGDYETYSTLPNNYAQVCYASGWASPSACCSLIPGTGSPDYYHANGSGGAKSPSTWWATVSAHTGLGFEGFAAWYRTSTNYREYISKDLVTALVPGASYEVSFWLNNGVSTLHYNGIKEVGAYFSMTPPTQTLGAPILVTPQVEMTSVLYTQTWTKITLYFVPTQAYKYITIGNFHNDATTTVTLNGPATSSGAYYYIDDVVVQPATPLPVTWLSFDAKKNDEHSAKVTWTTADEIDNDYFTVERSANGVDFTSIATVQGAGTCTNIHNYNVVDNDPLNGVNYYKIRQTDFNGTNSYSNIVSLKFNERAKDFVYLGTNNNNEAELILKNDMRNVQIELVDMNGRICSSFNYADLHENEIIQTPLMNLPSGIYLLRISNSALNESFKILKK